MPTMRVAALQMRSGTDPAINLTTFDTMVREAASQGARYIQSPEMTGFLVRGRSALMERIKTEAEDLLVQRAAALAAELAIYLHIGSTAILRADGKVANRAFLFGPAGQLIAKYDKIHMFDVDLDSGESWRESSTYAAGNEAIIADMNGTQLGLSICYDLRFPQLFQAQALAGAQVLTVPAAFTRQTGEAHWHALLRARAIENGAWVIAAAQGGTHEDGRETFGHSAIIDPWGRVVADAGNTEVGIVIADIDTEQSASARAKIPNLKNAPGFTVKNVALEAQE